MVAGKRQSITNYLPSGENTYLFLKQTPVDYLNKDYGINASHQNLIFTFMLVKLQLLQAERDEFEMKAVVLCRPLLGLRLGFLAESLVIGCLLSLCHSRRYVS